MNGRGVTCEGRRRRRQRDRDIEIGLKKGSPRVMKEEEKVSFLRE